MRCSVYIVYTSVLRCNNLKLHQILEAKNIFKQENIMLQLTFNPGLTLTGFRTTRPWIIVIPLSLVTSIFSYTKISLNLSHHQNQVHDHVPATTEPSKSIGHSAIQKGSVHCNMAAGDSGRLLSTLFCSCGFVD